MKKINIRVGMPLKYHRALKKKAKDGESIREQVKTAAIKQLIADGRVIPSKQDREIYGV